MVLYLLIFFYRCAIRGDKTVLRYIGCIPPRYHSVCANQGLSEQTGRPENAGRTIVVVLPDSADRYFAATVLRERGWGYLLLHAAEPYLHIERNGDGGGVFVSGDNDTDLFFIGVKAVA